MKPVARALTVISGVGLIVLALWWLLGAALLINDPPWSFVVALYSFALAGTGLALLFPPPVRDLYYLFAVLLPVIPYILALIIGIASPHGLDTNVPLTNYLVVLIPAAPAVTAVAAWRLSSRALRHSESGNISGNS